MNSLIVDFIFILGIIVAIVGAYLLYDFMLNRTQTQQIEICKACKVNDKELCKFCVWMPK